MAQITKAQLREIEKIIKQHMNVIMQLTTGDGQPSPELVRKLKLPKQLTDLIDLSYKYGKVCVLSGKNLANVGAQDVEKLLKLVKLTKSQQRSIDFMKMKAQQSIDTITQRITSGIITMVVQSDLNMWEAVKDVVPTALENNTPRYKVIQQLREKTGDWQRDWHRVAHTEMWSAKCQGEVEAIVQGESPLSSKGKDTLVYVRPAWNACNKCKQLYLENDNITPKTFTITELLSNGNNYGKRQVDWKPCIPPLHPNCMCTINVMPPHTKFDSQGNLVPGD